MTHLRPCWMAFLSILGNEPRPPHTDLISLLHLDKNNLPSVFASVLLRPQPLQKPEWCNVKQRPHLFHFLNCARPTRAFQFSIPFYKGVAEVALYCAHRTSTV
jgi:hypothetical protein